VEFWNENVIESSWKVLQELRKEFDFILIGGWASWLITKTLKSRDVDIVVDYQELEKIRLRYDLKHNSNLRKYEIRIRGIDVDIYVPHYSKIGIDLSKIKIVKIQGFKVVCPEQLLIMKQFVWKKRTGEKKKKDEIDIFALVTVVDFDKYKEFLKQENKMSYIDDLISVVKNFKDYKYLNLTPRKFKLLKEKILKELKRL